MGSFQGISITHIIIIITFIIIIIIVTFFSPDHFLFLPYFVYGNLYKRT